jgi:FAD/FMN-containing dehydrogenase
MSVIELGSRLRDYLGDGGWLEREAAGAYSRDWLDRFGVLPIGVARPTSTQAVARVMNLCHTARVSVTPQGGRTGLCGAGVTDRPDGILLSLERMKAIGNPDRASGAICAEAGVTLAALHAALGDTGLMFPMHFGAEGTAQIGGAIGTNAGGSHAFRFGSMQDLVLGLEVVLPDGQIWNGLRSVQKDNAGYQLRRLFCGAEGTLGVVTRAILRLYPAPKSTATALLGLEDCAALVSFGETVRSRAFEFVDRLEFFSETGIQMALKNVTGLHFPLDIRTPYYLLVEMTCVTPGIRLDEVLEECLMSGMQSGAVLSGAIAVTEAQRSAFWRLREEQPEGQRLEGAQMKFDMAVPPGKIAEFIERAKVICAKLMPGVRVNPFGHLGDGNVHFNLSPPAGRREFGSVSMALGVELAGVAASLGGSFAAEHGLGRSKIHLAEQCRDRAERALGRAIKRAVDPLGLMNPDVIFRVK